MRIQEFSCLAVANESNLTTPIMRLLRDSEIPNPCSHGKSLWLKLTANL